MSSSHSNDGDYIRKAIASFFQELGRVTGPSGFPVQGIECRSSTGNKEVRAVGYVCRDDTVFGDDGRSIVVLPNGPDVSLDESLTLMRQHRAADSCHYMFFIDCYSTRHKWNAQTSGYLTPEMLWSRFFGGRLKPFATGYEANNSELLQDVAQEYKPRVLLMPRPSSASAMSSKSGEDLISMAGAAREVLNAWARSERDDLRERLLVFGEAGIGKTWLLCRFAQEQRWMSDEHNPWIYPVALYVDLSSVKDDLLMGTGLDSLLSKYILLNGYAPYPRGGIPTIEALIGCGSVILLLDEFDTITRQFDQTVVEHHCRLILQSLPPRARLIVATRSTRFTSRARMIATFTMRDPYGRSAIMHLEPEHEAKGAAPFSVVTIAEFADFGDFLLSESDTADDADPTLLAALADFVHGDMKLTEIGRIARYADAVRKTFLLMKAKGDDLVGIRVFELAILWQLRFNLTTGRAIYELDFKEFGRTESQLLDLHTRLRILERIAWFLVEFERVTINSEEMKHAILEYAPGYFEEAINDLKCQTVFEFNDEESSDLRFRLKVLKAFFAARRIFSLICGDDGNDGASEEEERTGIRILGSHEASKIDEGYGFLGSFVKYGFLDIPPDPENGPMEAPERGDYWKNRIRFLKIESIIVQAKELILTERAFSNTTRHLVENLGAIGIDVSSLKERDEWSRNLEAQQDRESRDRVKEMCSRGVFVHGIEAEKEFAVEIHPFLIGKTEVVNRDFLEFLGHSDFIQGGPVKHPLLDRLDCESTALLQSVGLADTSDWHQVSIGLKRNEIHPLAWEVIHKADERIVEGPDRWLRMLTNDYHLFDWTNGKVPTDGLERPVVWVSFNVSAVYCNWKSEREGLSPAYRIVVRTGDPSSSKDDSKTAHPAVLVFLNPRSDGYRLPFSTEWAFAARAGRPVESRPWDRERNAVVRRRLKNALTSPHLGDPAVLPVTRNFCNDFGVYGMIGNVREWAEDDSLYGQYCNMRSGALDLGNGDSRSDLRWQDLRIAGRIIGSTWALGEGTFQYSHTSLRKGMVLPRGNTNPDVGFRWARSPSPADSEFVSREVARKEQLRNEEPKGGTR